MDAKVGSILEIEWSKLHESIVESVFDGVYFVDRNRRILYWNAAAERLTGYAAADVIGRRCADGLLRHCDGSGHSLCGAGCPLLQVMHDGECHEAHVFMHHADGHRIPVHIRGAPLRDGHGAIIGAVEIFTDDTDRVSALERVGRLEQEVHIDELTGIANRRYFDRMLRGVLAAFTRDHTPFGVLMIDIDHFKRFNDEHGHETGDEVLRFVAQTLGHACRANDTPARWGGEEFAVIVDGVDAAGLRVAAERVRAMIEAAGLQRDGRDLSVTVSVGAAMGDGLERAATVMERADAALYTSKQQGRNRVTLAP